jgi:chaperonin GroES
VVDLGDGRALDGTTRKFTLQKGNTVLYSKFGFMYTDIKLGSQDYILIREDDVIGVMPRASEWM